jgi:hypothetical protein
MLARPRDLPARMVFHDVRDNLLVFRHEAEFMLVAGVDFSFITR